MNAILAIVLLGGSCNVCNAKAVVAAPVVTTTAAVVQLPVLDPYWHYAAGQAERIRKLEEIAIRQAETQQRIVEALTAGAAAASPGQPAPPPADPARQLLADHCVKCHGAAKQAGGLRLDVELDAPTKLLVAEVVQSGAMPPKPQPALSDEDAATIAAAMAADSKALRAWLRAQRMQPQPPPAESEPPTPNP